jgi:hypothetical protein
VTQFSVLLQPLVAALAAGLGKILVATAGLVAARHTQARLLEQALLVKATTAARASHHLLLVAGAVEEHLRLVATAPAQMAEMVALARRRLSRALQ